MVATAMKNITEQLIIVNNFFDPISIIIQSTIFYSLHLLIQPVQIFKYLKKKSWKGSGKWNIKMESTLEK